MPHHIYQTKGLVLRGIQVGDANEYIDVFTRDVGRVRAVAKSTRVMKSKLRYSLQKYTISDVSLVRGKQVWRVTGAVEDSNLYYDLKNEKEKIFLFSHVTSLLGRLLQGEEKNEYLFDVITGLSNFLHSPDSDGKDIKVIECLVVLRILYSLGYVADKGAIFQGTTYKDEDLEFVSKDKQAYIQEINSALSDSHL